MSTGIQLDDNGDEIVLEGIAGSSAKKWGILALVYTLLVLASFGILIIALPCLIATNCFCMKKWRLYLTHTDIHYNPGCQYVLTPLSEINSIAIIPGTNNIQIIKKHGSIYAGANSVVVTNILKIDSVANCKEFVAAVKQEIARSQQQD